MQGPMGMAEVKSWERDRKTPEYKRNMSAELAKAKDWGGFLLKEAALSAALGGGIGLAFRHGRRLAGLRKLKWLSPKVERRVKIAAEVGQTASNFIPDGNDEKRAPGRRADPGKLMAQRALTGRSRMLEGGKLARVNGRQMWMSDDGYVETERTMTVQRDDGRWVNIPSFNPRTGRDYPSESAALEGARREGYVMKSYRDLKSAEIGAAAKSRRTGEELRKRGY